ncbi:hypothetical protein WCLP8_1020003 [uncultured Gammaproteobacteria bacterium]
MITAGCVGAFVHYGLGLGWLQAFLIGSIGRWQRQRQVMFGVLGGLMRPSWQRTASLPPFSFAKLTMAGLKGIWAFRL